MKKFIFLFVMLGCFSAGYSMACSEKEFKALDKYISETQENHLAEKSAQLNSYLQQMKAKKNLNDKALLSHNLIS